MQSSTEESTKKARLLPFKSLAGALWFSILLGPVGLLYASTFGGSIMIILGFIVMSSKFLIPIIIVWLISCIWAVYATNKYNKKLV